MVLVYIYVSCSTSPLVSTDATSEIHTVHRLLISETVHFCIYILICRSTFGSGFVECMSQCHALVPLLQLPKTTKEDKESLP